MKSLAARRAQALVKIVATIVVLSTLGTSSAQAKTRTQHCTSWNINCAWISTDVRDGVPFIYKDNVVNNLTISSAYVLDKQGSKVARSHSLTNSQIGNRRWQPFFFRTGSIADAICFDVKDDGKGAICHRNVR